MDDGIYFIRTQGLKCEGLSLVRCGQGALASNSIREGVKEKEEMRGYLAHLKTELRLWFVIEKGR
jgi:hypothetical protein